MMIEKLDKNFEARWRNSKGYLMIFKNVNYNEKGLLVGQWKIEGLLENKDTEDGFFNNGVYKEVEYDRFLEVEPFEHDGKIIGRIKLPYVEEIVELKDKIDQEYVNVKKKREQAYLEGKNIKIKRDVFRFQILDEGFLKMKQDNVVIDDKVFWVVETGKANEALDKIFEQYKIEENKTEKIYEINSKTFLEIVDEINNNEDKYFTKRRR